jgi:hypothetical protein
MTPLIDPVVSGTAQSATISTVVLAAAPGLVADDQFNRYYIVITNGNAVGQVREIVDSVLASDTVTVFPAFDMLPAGTPTYSIYQVLRHERYLGLSSASDVAELTLGTNEMGVAQWYEGLNITILDGDAQGETRKIVSYSAVRVASVNKAWDTTPTAASRYSIEGHLYFPMSEYGLIAFPTDNLIVGYDLGDIGMGHSRTIATASFPFGPFDDFRQISTLEVASDGSQRQLTLERWED